MSFVIWITGVVGSGKTTLARELQKHIPHSVVLDGNEIRQCLYPDLGFSERDRRMHNDVVLAIAEILTEWKVPVIVALVSPYRNIREDAREIFGDRFLEIYLYCDLEDRMIRKGLYAKALTGELKNLTGLDGEYEEPTSPDFAFNTSNVSVETEVELILKELEKRDFI